MQIAVFGTGMIGKTLAEKLAGLGHAVAIGGRGGETAGLADWRNTPGIAYGSYRAAVESAEGMILATRGDAVLDAVRAAGIATFSGMLVIDVTNPLDLSGEGIPGLLPELSNPTSAGEEVQRLIPDAQVVKALNTMNPPAHGGPRTCADAA